MTPFDKEIWARTIFMEASGEGSLGIRGVAHAINNRHTAGKWFSGETIAETCLFAKQFSSWNSGDPNRTRMARLADDDAVLLACRAAVDAVVAGDDDPTQGSTHYFSTSMILPPEWSKTGIFTVQIGKHKFYRDVR